MLPFTHPCLPMCQFRWNYQICMPRMNWRGIDVCRCERRAGVCMWLWYWREVWEWPKYHWCRMFYTICLYMCDACEGVFCRHTRHASLYSRVIPNSRIRLKSTIHISGMWTSFVTKILDRLHTRRHICTFRCIYRLFRASVCVCAFPLCK